MINDEEHYMDLKFKDDIIAIYETSINLLINKIKELEKEIEELKEYKWMYEGLQK